MSVMFFSPQLETGGIDISLVLSVEDERTAEMFFSVGSKNKTSALVMMLWQHMKLLQGHIPNSLQVHFILFRYILMITLKNAFFSLENIYFFVIMTEPSFTRHLDPTMKLRDMPESRWSTSKRSGYNVASPTDQLQSPISQLCLQQKSLICKILPFSKINFVLRCFVHKDVGVHCLPP